MAGVAGCGELQGGSSWGVGEHRNMWPAPQIQAATIGALLLPHEQPGAAASDARSWQY